MAQAGLRGVLEAGQELTPGLQCCLRCGRVLTDRALHDSFEEPALASLGVRRAAGSAARGGGCGECIEDYRSLLGERRERVAARGAEAQVRTQSGVGAWLRGWLGGAQA